MPFIQTSSTALTSVLERTGVLVPGVLLALVVLMLLYPDHVVGTHPKRKGIPQMPWAFPLVGNTFLLVKNGTARQFHRLEELTRNNDIGIMQSSVLGLGRQFMVVRPEYIEAVQKTHFDNFVKGELFRERFQDVLGAHGIFVADGETWRTQRKRASNIFSAGQFRTWVQSTVQGELAHVVALLDAVAAREDNTLVLSELFFRYTLSSFSKMAYNADLDCLGADPAILKRPVPFAQAFDYAQGVINDRFIDPFFKLTELLSVKGAKMRAARAQLRKTGLEIISARLEERKRTGASTTKKDGADLLDLFMDITQDPEDLLVVVMNFLIAGRDTTAQTLSWLFYYLFENPQHIPQLVAEIESVYGPARQGKAHMMGYDDIKRMPRLQAAFAEATRLSPAVPKNGKICIKDVVLQPGNGLTPLEVRAGEWVGWSDWVMNRRPDVWGEDAAEFKPERFLIVDEQSGELSFVNHNEWKYHSFNGAYRRCLGRTLAFYEGMAFLVAALPLFDIAWATEEEGQTASRPLEYLNSVTHPCQPYVATVRRRQDSKAQ